MRKTLLNKYHAVTRTSENRYQAFYYPISNRLYNVPRVQKITKGKWKYVHIYVLFITVNRLYSILCKSLHISSFNFGIPIKELLLRLFKQGWTQDPTWIIQFSLVFFFLKYEYNCFTMLCYFLLNAENNDSDSAECWFYCFAFVVGQRGGIGRIIFRIENTDDNKVLRLKQR